MHRIITALALAAVLTLAAGAASALNQPTKGKSYKTNIMVAYEECTAPTIQTDTGLDACLPAPSDPQCGFSESSGIGKFQLKTLTTGNSGYRIRMNKLEPSCEGDQLNFAITTRRSGEHCQSALGGNGDCTAVDHTQVFASCAVTNNSCKAAGQFQLDGGSQPGQVEILDIVITNQSNGGVRGFRVGIINNKIIR